MNTNPFYWTGYFLGRAKYEFRQGFTKGNYPSIGRMDSEFLAILGDRTNTNTNTSGYVSAIKQYRNYYGSTLRDAKDAIDALMAKHGIQR